MKGLTGLILGAATALPAPATGQNTSSAEQLETGQAEIHYLGHSGWAIRTRHHLLIFDYWEAMKSMPPGATYERPADASLSKGFIVSSEIGDQTVIVFVSHAHSDHFDPVVLDWRESIDDIHYVFGWEFDGQADVLRVDQPKKSFTINGAHVHTISHDFDGIPEAAFLVQVDGVTLYHSGDHGSSTRTRQRFQDNIDHFAGIAASIDVAFTATWGGEDYMAARLNPSIVFPQHEGGYEDRLRRWAERGAGASLAAEVCVVENRGDRFLYVPSRGTCPH